MVRKTLFEIGRILAMKTSKTIKSRGSLTSMRSGRAYGIARYRMVMAVLTASIAWAYAPAARAEGNFWCAENGLVSACNLDGTPTNVISIPGLVDFLTFETQGNLVERTTAGTAHFTGVVHKSNDTNVEFDVDMTFSGRLNPSDDGFPPAGSPVLLLQVYCPVDASTWHYYTALTGTLTGRPGSIYDGAVYSVTLGSIAAQVGEGANNRSQKNGLWAPIIVEAIGELPDPNLPTGPFEGSVNIMNRFLCYPPPIIDLTGTWTGSIECAGYDFDVEAVPQEQLSTDVVLKLGNRSDYSLYSAEVTENATVETFCAKISNDLEKTQSGQGRLLSSTGTAQPIFLKVAGVDRDASPNPTGTLRARQIRITPEGTLLCKWSLTLTDTADPQIVDSCTP